MPLGNCLEFKVQYVLIVYVKNTSKCFCQFLFGLFWWKIPNHNLTSIFCGTAETNRERQRRWQFFIETFWSNSIPLLQKNMIMDEFNLDPESDYQQIMKRKGIPPQKDVLVQVDESWNRRGVWFPFSMVFFQGEYVWDDSLFWWGVL